MSARALLSVAASFSDSSRNDTNLQLAIIGAGFICVCFPLDASQLLFALMGALTYAISQGGFLRTGKTKCQRAAEREHAQHRKLMQARAKASSNRYRNACVARHASTSKPDVYTISAVPVAAPKFESSGFDAEARELVNQLTPSMDEVVGVEKLTQYVKVVIQEVLPTVDVTAFVHGSLKRGTAFSVAVPEVDLVASATPAMLAQFLHFRTKRGGLQDLGGRKLKKSAIRLCADQLLAKGGMRFRRSAFRGDEPRMTLLVMPELGFFSDGIPVDISINAVMPFYTSSLPTVTGKVEPQAKALMLFVKRWAKNRGICHVAKGHLSPYMWSLLVMYFLQVRGDGPLLPALENSAILSGLRLGYDAGVPQFPKCVADTAPATASDSNASSCQECLGRLFIEFVKFYDQEFDWHNEAVSVRLGRRAPPDPQLPRVVFDTVVDQQKLAPAIEDPFSTHRNLSDSMNAVSFTRLQTEIRRAVELCENEASLTDLLTPWAPEVEELPERDTGSSDKDV